MVVVFVFFFKQKTAYEMRISDWSSDVCSSDLHLDLLLGTGPLAPAARPASGARRPPRHLADRASQPRQRAGRRPSRRPRRPDARRNRPRRGTTPAKVRITIEM